MKTKTVLVCVVVLAAVSLAGCVSRTGTGTGTNNYSNRADSAPAAVVVGTTPKSATQASASNAK